MPLKKHLKNLLYLLIRIILSFGLLFFLFHKFDFSKTWQVIKGADLKYLIFVLLLTFFINFLLLLRWYMLIRTLGVKINFKKVASAFSMGLFFNIFLPSSAGGDVARSIDLFGHTRERVKIVASVILDRLSGFISIAIISSFSLFAGYRLINNRPVLLILVAVLACLVIVIAVLFSSRIFLRFSRLFGKFKGIRLKLERLHLSIIVYRSKYFVILVNVLLSFITQFLAIIAISLIAKSLHAEISFIYFLIFVPLIFVIAMLPVSVGGLGVRESAFVGLFYIIGVDKNISFGISLINSSTILIVGILGGIIYGVAFYLRRLQHHKASLL